MGVLTNYKSIKADPKEGWTRANKGSLVSAADWILTPYRKIFNGKDVELVIRSNSATVKEISTPEPIAMETVGWAILAIVSTPLALIAAVFKRVSSTSIELRHSGDSFTFNERCAFEQFLQGKGLSGKVKIQTVVGEISSPFHTEHEFSLR